MVVKQKRRATAIHYGLLNDAGELIEKGFGPPPAGEHIVFENESDAERQFPALHEARERQRRNRPLSVIDAEAILPIAIERIIKADEARLLLYGGVSDPVQLPYLSAEADATGIELQTLAATVWEKHAAAAMAVANRRARKFKHQVENE